MKKILMTLFVAGLLMFGGIGTVGADLIETDFLATGDNLLTYDEDTGIEWLDLSETRGYSFNEVINGIGEYTTTYRFRAAMRDEVAQLYTNAGIVNLNAEFVIENVPGVALLHDLMGCTQCGTDTQSAHGFIGEFTTDVNVRSAAIDFAFFPFNELRARADISITFGPPNERNKDIGTYLVRVKIFTIDHILDFFDDSVADGTLGGYGPGNSANGRLNALRNMLEMAGDLISIGDIEGACGQLKAALKKCDGKRKPPDFVSGPAASDLHYMIAELVEELGCE